MADYLSFVQAGSTVTKPEGSCCSGLKTILKADVECLCKAFKSNASLGVTLNVTNAQTLPSLCKVSAPSDTNCALPACKRCDMYVLALLVVFLDTAVSRNPIKWAFWFFMLQHECSRPLVVLEMILFVNFTGIVFIVFLSCFLYNFS